MGCCQGVKHAIAGARGLAKAFLGLDPTPRTVLLSRRALCEACPHRVPNGNEIGKCRLCGCWLRFKLVLNDEACPDKRW
jgi:hypothetical protein